MATGVRAEARELGGRHRVPPAADPERSPPKVQWVKADQRHPEAVPGRQTDGTPDAPSLVSNNSENAVGLPCFSVAVEDTFQPRRLCERNPRADRGAESAPLPVGLADAGWRLFVPRRARSQLGPGSVTSGCTRPHASTPECHSRWGRLGKTYGQETGAFSDTCDRTAYPSERWRDTRQQEGKRTQNSLEERSCCRQRSRENILLKLQCQPF